MCKENSKCLVVFSGGQDSTTVLGWALKEFASVEAISFAYGQKHGKEIAFGQAICEKLGVKQTIINMESFGLVADSALITHGDVNVKNKKGLPSSFVPNRNQMFITLAHAYAQKIGADSLALGVCQTDYSGYPDCRIDFIRAIETATNLGSDESIKIYTPLMYLTKAKTFELAEELGILEIVITLSHTCYNGNHHTLHEWGYGCGECPACKLREKGYAEYCELKKDKDGS